MFKNLSLQARMVSAFIFMGLLVLAVALVGWMNNTQLSQQLNKISINYLPSVDAIWQINDGQSLVLSAKRKLLDPTITDEDRQEALSAIDAGWTKITDGQKHYEAHQMTSQEEQIYNELKDALDKWRQFHAQFVTLDQQYNKLGIRNPWRQEADLIRDGKTNTPAFATVKTALDLRQQLGAIINNQGKGVFTQANEYSTQLLELNREGAKQAQTLAAKSLTDSGRWTMVGIILGPITAIVLGIIFSNTIARPLGAKIARVVGVAEQISVGDLTVQVDSVAQSNDEIEKLLTAFRRMTHNLNALIMQVQQAGIQVTTSATKISASGKQLEATATEQVAATNQVVATSREIATTSIDLTRTMEDVATSAQRTTLSATESQKSLEQMAATMQQLVRATDSISSKLEVISNKANNINSVVTTITKVADQTNLLSLNAAIEAEKAGEYGLGFAVVAREIRRLADQTAVATLDIEQMVKEMQSAVSAGVMEMDRFAKEVERGVDDVSHISLQLGQIINQVQDLTPQFAAVSEGMEAQTQGSQQISEAMMQLGEASVQTADALRGINGAIEQLNQAAQGLRREIARFKVNTDSIPSSAL